MEGITYNVRLWKIEVYRGKKVTTYKVRWTAAGKPWKRSFRTRAQAASFEAGLRTAAAKGEASGPGLSCRMRQRDWPSSKRVLSHSRICMAASSLPVGSPSAIAPPK
jgi:hypothetical protein